MFEVIMLSCAEAVPAWQPDFVHVTPSEGDPEALSGDPLDLECVLVLSNKREAVTTSILTKKK